MGAAPATIRSYQPGDLGRLATLNVMYHTTECNFLGPIFESKITAIIAAFLETLEAPGNGWWPVELYGDYVWQDRDQWQQRGRSTTVPVHPK